MMNLLPLLAILLIGIAYVYQRRIPSNGTPLAVLGSGGHTGELLTVLKSLDLRSLDFVYGTGDSLSIEKARLGGYAESTFYGLPRARRVGEPRISTVFSVLKSLLAAIALMYRTRPQLVLCNGPATCVTVVFAAKLLFLRTKIVYIESLARVSHLSLSGNIIYQMNWADRFVVQWPELAQRYPNTIYEGVLV